MDSICQEYQSLGKPLAALFSPPNVSLQRTLDPVARLATPSLAPGSSAAELCC